MSDFALFKYLEKPAMLRAFIIQEDGSKFRLEAVARIIAEPYLELKFRPGELPPGLVRPGGKILLSMDTRAGTVSMYSHVDEVLNLRVLRVVGSEAFSYAQQREYFRVNTAIKVVYSKQTLSSIVAPRLATASINLSGSGVLITTEERLAPGDTYVLDFYLPEVEQVFSCHALVVRVDERLRRGFEVAMHFFNIEPEVRDRLISFCLAEQRRQLRTKVQVAGF